MVKQEAAAAPANRFSISLETLNLPQIIAEDEPLLRDASDKFDGAQAGIDGADKVKKQLSSAIRDSVSGLSRSNLRFARVKSLVPAFILFAIR